MFFDRKNIERAESVLSTRRAAKKLVNWIADTQHILANVTRVWIEGKTNIIADAGSRAAVHTPSVVVCSQRGPLPAWLSHIVARCKMLVDQYMR